MNGLRKVVFIGLAIVCSFYVIQAAAIAANPTIYAGEGCTARNNADAGYFGRYIDGIRNIDIHIYPFRSHWVTCPVSASGPKFSYQATVDGTINIHRTGDSGSVRDYCYFAMRPASSTGYSRWASMVFYELGYDSREFRIANVKSGFSYGIICHLAPGSMIRSYVVHEHDS